MVLTIKDLIDFILLNKGTTTFIGYNEEQIAYMVRKGIEDNSLFYNVNDNYYIDGMILAEIDHGRKIIFVTENLAMNLKNLKTFFIRAIETWPEYTLEAIRHSNKHRKYNVDKLYKKLCQVEHQEVIINQHHS